MIRGQTIGLVIPCHNEEEGLQQILPHRPSEIDQLIVVDNNSTDGSVAVARQYQAQVITEHRPGYGSAYQAGFASVTTDIVVTMDGDGQYPITEVRQLVHYLQERNLDFVSAARFPLLGQNMPLVRQVGNKLLTLATLLLFGINMKDTQSGMWVLRRSILDRIPLTELGMAFSEELKIKVVLAGLRFEEVHIPYLPRAGSSKLLPLSDGWKNLMYLLRLRWQLRRK